MLWMFPWNICAVHLSVNDYHFKPMGHHLTEVETQGADKVLFYQSLVYLSAVPSFQVQVCRCGYSERRKTVIN